MLHPHPPPTQPPTNLLANPYVLAPHPTHAPPPPHLHPPAPSTYPTYMTPHNTAPSYYHHYNHPHHPSQAPPPPAPHAHPYIINHPYIHDIAHHHSIVPHVQGSSVVQHVAYNHTVPTLPPPPPPPPVAPPPTTQSTNQLLSRSNPAPSLPPPPPPASSGGRTSGSTSQKSSHQNTSQQTSSSNTASTSNSSTGNNNDNSKMASSSSSSNDSSRRRRTRCKKCESCLRADCGDCHFCRDMKKFGGPGRMKQSCIARQCLAPVLPHTACCIICGRDGWEKLSIDPSLVDEMSSSLMECSQCWEIVHPFCLNDRYPDLFLHNKGYINKELPNSWECPKCVKSGNSSKQNPSSKSTSHHHHASAKAAKAINWSMTMASNKNKESSSASGASSSSSTSATAKRLKTDDSDNEEHKTFLTKKQKTMKSLNQLSKPPAQLPPSSSSSLQSFVSPLQTEVINPNLSNQPTGLIPAMAHPTPVPFSPAQHNASTLVAGPPPPPVLLPPPRPLYPTPATNTEAQYASMQYSHAYVSPFHETRHPHSQINYEHLSHHLPPPTFPVSSLPSESSTSAFQQIASSSSGQQTTSDSSEPKQNKMEKVEPEANVSVKKESEINNESTKDNVDRNIKQETEVHNEEPKQEILTKEIIQNGTEDDNSSQQNGQVEQQEENEQTGSEDDEEQNEEEEQPKKELKKPMFVVRPAPLDEDSSEEEDEDEDDEQDEQDLDMEDSIASSTIRKRIREKKMRLLMKRFSKKLNENLSEERDVMVPVFRYLARNDLLKCMTVSKCWHDLCCDASLWRTVTVKPYTKINSRILVGIVRRQPRSLDLSWTGINKKQLSWLLPRLPQLQHLKLAGCSSLTISALHSCHCPLLSTLDLSWTESFCEELVRCLLSRPPDSRPGLVELKTRLRYLSEIRLAGTLITDESLRHMNQNLPFIKKIDVSECHLITDSGIASLAISKSDKLSELNLSGCSKITDASLKLLRNCKSLEKLDVQQCLSISKEACERFIDCSAIVNDNGADAVNIAASAGMPSSDSEIEQDMNKTQQQNKLVKTRKFVKKRTGNRQQQQTMDFWQQLKDRLFVRSMQNT